MEQRADRHGVWFNDILDFFKEAAVRPYRDKEIAGADMSLACDSPPELRPSRRIALVISSLSAGGAERVMTTMANHWAAHGWDVTLITLGSPDGDWYSLHRNVTRVGLDLLRPSSNVLMALRHNAERVNRLRYLLRISRPDVVLSFIDRMNVLTLLAALGLGLPVIVSERTDPREYPVGGVWSGLRSLMYRRAAAVVVQTRALHTWAARLTADNRVHVIPNPVEPQRASASPAHHEEQRSRTIVAMGRLSREKAFDLLIHAFHRCAKKHPEWSLVILGEGDERRSLEALAAELNMKDRISLPGLSREPAQILRRAQIFVLSSRYEGFPNALLEAMACGVTVIATDCAGPREIIRDGVDGLLIPPGDVDALIVSMDRLMGDPVARERLGERATEVRERFSLEHVMAMWESLVLRVEEHAIGDFTS
jgi:glycosyltransferase involved in cell wall biosynthesis